MKLLSIENAEHYVWGDACDGWHLLKRSDVSVIQERVPPGKTETRHLHQHARQFFYILEGEASIAFEDEAIVVKRHQGVEVLPGVAHQFQNNSLSDVVFLVISVPPSQGDRKDL